jgi:hypothetical protein
VLKGSYLFLLFFFFIFSFSLFFLTANLFGMCLGVHNFIFILFFIFSFFSFFHLPFFHKCLRVHIYFLFFFFIFFIFSFFLFFLIAIFVYVPGFKLHSFNFFPFLLFIHTCLTLILKIINGSIIFLHVVNSGPDSVVPNLFRALVTLQPYQSLFPGLDGSTHDATSAPPF